MLPTANKEQWDFSPALDLLQSLASRDPTPGSHDRLDAAALSSTSDNDSSGGVSLGDFSQLWAYLGVESQQSKTPVPTFEASIATTRNNNNDDAYISDGALYYPASSKTVKWRDETDGGELTEVQECEGGSVLTKSQRKNRNRKLRKAAGKNQLLGAVSDANSADESDLNTDIEQLAARVPKMTSDAGKTSAVLHKSLLPHNVAPRKAPSAAAATHRAPVVSLYNPNTQVSSALLASASPKKASDSFLPQGADVSAENLRIAQKRLAAALGKTQQTPPRPSQSNNTQDDSLEDWPIAQPVFKRQQSEPADSFPTHGRKAGPSTIAPPPFHVVPKSTPSQVPTGKSGTHSISNLDGAALSDQSVPRVLAQRPHALNNRGGIAPLTQRSTSQRNWDLLLKLMNYFPENVDSLTSPFQLSYNHPVPHGIHVFVDASNILIGFMQHLKTVRGIPQNSRTPRVSLSFHALALLLERRRPVAKRVLAGSTPWVDAFDEAKQIGYDCCILDKVFKARELTQRQRNFAARVDGSGPARSGSDSADSTPTHAPPKWVEQGVDEILHLKIAESIIDTPAQKHALDTAKAETRPGGKAAGQVVPGAPTMVLATGDAAEAEYSGGFRRMVERALAHGWHVEVMAWGASINMDWRRLERKHHAKGQFRIIELNDFAEELFGSE